jgi:hypothetical protein
MMSEYARQPCWINSNRKLCELQTDGSILFVEDITIDELKWLVGVMLREHQDENHKRITNAGN